MMHTAGMEVEVVTRKVRQQTTTAAAGGTDKGDSDELGAVCMLGLDGTRRISVMRSIGNNVEGSDSEGA